MAQCIGIDAGPGAMIFKIFLPENSAEKRRF
jgi:hypothetical protein